MRFRFATAAAIMGALATNSHGQLPAIPAAPAVAVPAVPVAPAVPSIAAPARNIYSFFMLTPDQKAACVAKKDKFCRSSLGQLINSAAKPVGAFTGGLVPSCCPPSATDPNAPNPEDLKKPATEAEGAAARIKELEAGAAKRRSAVRYLGTVNCKRFPEAETALIGALRTDTNECVRFEAATALARGCCCTTKTVKALTLTVEGTDTDGNPAETSQRVRTMASLALARCCGTVESAAPKEPPPELPPERPSPEATARRTEVADREKALVEGRRVLGGFQSDAMPGVATGRRTVVDTFRYATALAAPSPYAVTTTIVPNTPPAPTIIPAAATIPIPTTSPITPTPKPGIGNLPTGQRGLFNLMWASRAPDR